jgi:hypothetical protein
MDVVLVYPHMVGLYASSSIKDNHPGCCTCVPIYDSLVRLLVYQILYSAPSLHASLHRCVRCVTCVACVFFQDLCVLAISPLDTGFRAPPSFFACLLDNKHLVP